MHDWMIHDEDELPTAARDVSSARDRVAAHEDPQLDPV
jgi:hypothetical protein